MPRKGLLILQTKKYLLPGIYIGFTEKHFLLLYESLVNVFADKVIFEQK